MYKDQRELLVLNEQRRMLASVSVTRAGHDAHGMPSIYARNVEWDFAHLVCSECHAGSANVQPTWARTEIAFVAWVNATAYLTCMYV